MATYPPLKRSRLSPGSYELLDSNGRAIVRVDKTGTDGRDNYPWDYHFLVKLNTDRRVDGVASTLTEAVDETSARWAQYGEKTTSTAV